ncbi:hypothetical protein [Pseudomonas sp. JV241A]|uniref:hypothetical protein n=1 Tax=Pseudomonas sp. JV241A TaxID=2078785 RepID=UPI00100D4657|nr:hypothetical protein [Pseudomonas sp. JV241A]SPO65571.1 conserved protein of unknown function [Pseudomonas sp. JV241A]
MSELIQSELPLELPSASFAEVNGIQMGVLNDTTPYLTERGLARLCGVNPKTISDLANNWNEEKLKPRGKRIKQILTQHSFISDRIVIKTEQNGQKISAYPDAVCMAVLEYYAFDSDSTDAQIAQRNYRVLARKTLRDFIYESIGFSPESLKLDSWRHYHDRILLNKLPAGYFSVFREIADIVVSAIESGLIIDTHTVPDISVGQMWASHWKTKKLEDIHGQRIKHPHEYPDYFPQSAAFTEANIYPLSALGEFRIWLESTYLPEKFPTYLQKKIAQGLIPKSTAGTLLQSLKKL